MEEQVLLTLHDGDHTDEDNVNDLEPVLELEVAGSPASDAMLDDLGAMEASSVHLDGNILDTMGIYVERPDGSPVRIAFLADIDGDQQMFPLLSDASEYEPTVLIEESDCDLTSKHGHQPDRDQETMSTFINSETSQQLTAIRAPDGQIICFIEPFSSPSALPGDARDQPSNRTMLYSLLNKGFNLHGEQQLSLSAADAVGDETQAALVDGGNDKIVIYAKKAKTKRVQSSIVQIGGDLPIEEKLQVLESMLPPREAKKPVKREVEEEGEGGQTYDCDMCSASFAKATQFYGHSHTHTGERSLTCKYCKDGKMFSAHAKLSSHERRYHRSARRHACSECAARFERASQLEYHRRRVHLGERPHVCSVCAKAFFKMSDLRGHVNIHLGLDAKVCHVCGRKFSHVSNLNRHMRTHSGVKPYPCTKCGRRFNQPSGLANHELSHETQKLSVCGVCGKAFKHTYVMRRHVKTHHKDALAATTDVREMLQLKNGAAQSRRFYCAACGETFPFSVLLKRHERWHEKQNTLRCSACGRDMDSLEMLKTHCCRVPAADAEDAAPPDGYGPQLRSLLEYPEPTVGSSTGDFVIYVLQEGHEHPTQVHIRPATAADPQSIDDVESRELIDRMQVPDTDAAANEDTIIITNEEMQDYSHMSVLHQLDFRKASSQKSRVAKGSNRTRKIPKRTKKVHVIITKDVPYAKRATCDNNASEVDATSESTVTLVQHCVRTSESDGIAAGQVEDTSADATLRSSPQIVSSPEPSAVKPEIDDDATCVDDVADDATCVDDVADDATCVDDVADDATYGDDDATCGGDGADDAICGDDGANDATCGDGVADDATCGDDVVSSRLEEDLRDVATSTFSLSDVTLGLMKLNPSKVEAAPTSPLLSLQLSEGEDSRDDYYAGTDGLAGGDADEEGLQYECSVDPMSLFKASNDNERAVDVTVAVLADGNERPPKRHKKAFECPECHKVFAKNGNFKQHIAMHFVDQQRYCCPVCGQCFAWKSTLTKHVLRHGGPRQKYPCHMCHREYSLQSQVQDHIKRDHLKERSNVCSVCEKTFFKKHDLKIHLRTHTQEKPYMCKKCGKRFYHTSHIIRHEASHLGAKPFSCADCGRSFTQASSLKVHRLSANRCTARPLGPPPSLGEGEEEDLVLGEFRMTDDDDNIMSFSYHDANMTRDEF